MKTGTILEGPFEGFAATVVREDGDELRVEVEVFGRKTAVTIARARFRADDEPHVVVDWPEIESEIARAVANRGYRVRRMKFWMDRVDSEANADGDRLIALLAEAAVADAPIDAEEREEREAEIARAHAAWDALGAEERDVRWRRERGTWTEWRTQGRARTADVSTARFDGALALEERAFREATRRERLAHPLGDRSALAPRAANAELEAAIVDAIVQAEGAPDPGPFLVYGDWLQSAGDPRGELIALQGAARRDPRREEALIGAHARYLLGSLASLTEGLQLQWRFGFLRAATCEARREDEAGGLDVGTLTRELLALPSSRFLEELTIACPSTHEDGVADTLTRGLAEGGPRPTVRKLAFITNQEEEMLSWTSADLDGVSGVFPQLRSLRVRAGGVGLTAPLVLPHLETLAIETCGLTAENLAALTASRLPRLRALTVWFGSRSYGVTLGLDEVMPLLLALPTSAPSLDHLGLANCEFTDELCAALPPILEKTPVTTLDLSRGTMTDAGARVLADRCQTRFDRLIVSENYLTADGIALLDPIASVLESDEQRTAELYEGALHRYCAVGE